MSRSRTVSFYTLGCRLNQAETAQIAQRFRNSGYRLVEHGDPVDVAVIHTCSVTERADQRCRQEIRKVKRASPEATVCAVGCYSQSDPDAVRGILGVDLVVGNDRKYVLPGLVAEYEEVGEGPAVLVSPSLDFSGIEVPEEGDYPGTTRAHVKVQDGCDFHCAFCLLPRVRGAPRSRRPGEVVAAAAALARKGHREIVITGVNIGLYRHEDLDLGHVARAIAEQPGVDRVRVSSIEPSTIPRELLDWMADDPKACPHLHIPLQSGCDATLERMRRIYTTRDFAAFVHEARAAIPDLTVGTDVIVGFPGETEEEFATSRRFLEELPLDYLHVFSYSDRPRTSAAGRDGKVSPGAIKERSAALRELGATMRTRFLDRLRGRTAEVLLESVDGDGYRKGWTANYARVGVDPAEAAENDLVPVRIGAVRNDYCLGEVETRNRVAP